MVVSPDGSLRENNSLESTKVAIEIKCPVYKIQTHFPSRYLLQCLSEIEALGVESLLYLSWTRNETAVFRVQRDDELFSDALGIALNIYDGKCVKKPTKLDDKQKELRERITQKSKEVPLVGLFPSLISSNGENCFHQCDLQVNDVKGMLEDMINLANKNYELRRERASEAMVFLVADLGRSWVKENLRCAPVSWFPRGYSLSTENIRIIVEEIMNRCYIAGLHLPCQSFDGQWNGLVIRSCDGKPPSTNYKRTSGRKLNKRKRQKFLRHSEP